MYYIMYTFFLCLYTICFVDNLIFTQQLSYTYLYAEDTNLLSGAQTLSNHIYTELNQINK